MNNENYDAFIQYTAFPLQQGIYMLCLVSFALELDRKASIDLSAAVTVTASGLRGFLRCTASCTLDRDNQPMLVIID